MLSDASGNTSSAPGMSVGWRGWACDFWAGLTTPGPYVVLGALGFMVLCVVGMELMVREPVMNKRIAMLNPDTLWNHLVRASVIAMQGSRQHASGPEPLLLMVGPSAMRFWLPTETETSQLFLEVTGQPVRVRTLCGNAQTYAISAALLERFGADFDGWIVIAVDRQLIGRVYQDEELAERSQQSRLLGFDSAILTAESAFLRIPQPRATGLALQDRRLFNDIIGMRLFAHPRRKSGSYVAHDIKGSIYDPAGPTEFIAPLSVEMLDRHLAVLDRIVARARAMGRARVVLVETPLVDNFEPQLQTAAWKADEAIYARKMAEWSRVHAVPWLTGADVLTLTSRDYLDERHVGAPAFRRAFAIGLARELFKTTAP